MYRSLRRAALLLAALSAGVICSCAPGGREEQSSLIDKPAPEFAVDFAINGNAVGLADLKGKVVLLDFWAIWCKPCCDTFPHLRQWHDTYKDKGLEIVGITTYYEKFGFDRNTGNLISREGDRLDRKQEREMLRDFASYYDLKYRLALLTREERKAADKKYEVGGIPQVVLIDRQGRVRLVRVGADDENTRDIESKIKELLAEKK